MTNDVQHFHSKVVGVIPKNPDGSKRQDIIKAVDARLILIHSQVSFRRSNIDGKKKAWQGEIGV